MESVISIERLTKYYGKHKGIENLSLDVKEGEIYGFIGPNGSGKSTTIRILLGLLSPDQGTAKLFGKTAGPGKKEILKRIGYMPSEAFFYSNMKVEDILRLSARLYGQNCRKTALELCQRLKLDTKKPVNQLSLGNRKKVSIVCAFQHNADLYILDEPTSGLDPLMQKEFFSIVKEKNKAGATIFLSSHILTEIQRYCQKAAMIREGTVILEDEVSNICRTSAKRVTISGISSLDLMSLDKKDFPAGLSLSRLRHEENSISFLYQGKIPPLLRALENFPIEDLTIVEPDLEEIFLHFSEDTK